MFRLLRPFISLAFHCHLAERFDPSRCLIDVGLVEFNGYRIIDTLWNFKVILAIPFPSSRDFPKSR